MTSVTTKANALQHLEIPLKYHTKGSVFPKVFILQPAADLCWAVGWGRGNDFGLARCLT